MVSVGTGKNKEFLIPGIDWFSNQAFRLTSRHCLSVRIEAHPSRGF